MSKVSSLYYLSSSSRVSNYYRCCIILAISNKWYGMPYFVDINKYPLSYQIV